MGPNFIRAATDAGLDVYQALLIRGIAMSSLFVAFAAARRQAVRRVVASAAALVVRVVATRNVAPDTPALPVALFTAVGITTMTGVLSTLVGAVAIGYVAFDETPDALTLIGCALILVAGTWSTQIDRRLRSIVHTPGECP